VAAHDAVDERLDDLFAVRDVTDHDAAMRVAVLLADDDVLSDVHKTPRQIA